jgi:predicted metallopeptidase
VLRAGRVDRRVAVPNSPGPARGFDFTLHVRRLCTDLSARLSELDHVDMGRVAIRYCQTRKAVGHGLQASLTPLRFARGERVTRRGARNWTVERLYDAAGREMLYLLSFYLPRFLERPFEDKLATVVHELWHIGPAFDGDLRRHEGRCYVHSPSQKQYDECVGQLARKWLALDPPAELYEFLRFDFRALEQRHGRIFGQRIRTPKLIPASTAST